jgi:hypothetical protein
MDDGYASVALAPALNELFHERDGFIGRVAVQVEHVACGVVAALELAKLAPIDTTRDVSLLRSFPVVMTC